MLYIVHNSMRPLQMARRSQPDHVSRHMEWTIRELAADTGRPHHVIVLEL
jgi:hypothetical protein